ALRGGLGDEERARRLLGRADALASSLGLVRLSREIDALRERPGRGAWEGLRAPLDGNGRLLLASPTGRILAPGGVRALLPLDPATAVRSAAVAPSANAEADGGSRSEGRPAPAAREGGPAGESAAVDPSDEVILGPQDAPPGGANVFRKEGEYWAIAHGGSLVRLKDTKGLRCLARLLASPGRQIAAVELEASQSDGPPVPELVGAGSMAGSADHDGSRPDLGDAGAMLDPQAKAEYKAHIDELREALEEAEQFSDDRRGTEAREELDFLTSELARAVGL